jgi:HSP20 family protein
MLLRFDPFRDIDRLTDQASAARRAFLPMDAYRDGDHYFVHIDLPGVDPESIDITVEKNALTVQAERSWTPGEGVEVVATERAYGKFTRQLFLGEALDVDAIQADYDRGVLTLRIPVAEQAKPRRIEVSGHEGPRVIDTTSSVA